MGVKKLLAVLLTLAMAFSLLPAAALTAAAAGEKATYAFWDLRNEDNIDTKTLTVKLDGKDLPSPTTPAITRKSTTAISSESTSTSPPTPPRTPPSCSRSTTAAGGPTASPPIPSRTVRSCPPTAAASSAWLWSAAW